MWGPTLLLNSAGVGGMFPTAFERLNLGFYRGKITAWMAAQEEEYRWVEHKGLQAAPFVLGEDGPQTCVLCSTAEAF